MSKTLRRVARKIGCDDGVQGLFFGGREHQESATSTELLKKIESQEYKCALSGMELTPETASLDHVVPVSSGGSHDIENLQWVHADVNIMKSRIDQATFIRLCKKVAMHNKF